MIPAPDWEVWGACSVSCDGGTRRRINLCTHQGCLGPRSEEQRCNTHPCIERLGTINVTTIHNDLTLLAAKIYRLISQLLHLHSDCTGQADIAFVVDSSTSIRARNPADRSRDNWNLILQFMVNLVNRLPIGRDKVRVASVT